MDVENEATLKTAIRTGINLMLGAGFSVHASDADGRPLPAGGMLANELRTHFNVDEQQRLTLPQLYTILASRDREAADAYIKRRFSVERYDPRYRSIENLEPAAIFTTNVDDLPWRMYEDSAAHYLNDVMTRGPQFNDRAAVDYAPLHGSVRDDTRPYRFTTLEVATSFNADPTMWHTFRRRLQSAPTLFWGYALQDAAALEAIFAQDASGVSTTGKNWVVVRNSEATDPLIDYLRALQFQIIVADTSELLDYFGALTFHTSPTPHVGLSDSLAQYRVPASNRVAQRPLTEFYAGAAPAWSDIYRQDLHRLTQYRRAEDAINRRAGVVLTGIPACGKTTLLMQLAADGVGPGASLIPDRLTRESAERILRALGGAEATLFVDRLCDDIEAWNALCAADNVVAVGADRDFNIGTVTHRMATTGIQFVSLSELDDLDLGAIRMRIPATVRTPRMIHPETTTGTVSLLEFNLANTTSKSLALRLQEAVREFQRDDPESAEMLILVCYVHSCNTVLSMDMALGYWREHITEWQDVWRLVERVGQLLSEYDGELQEESQDHFAARSTVVAEQALEAAGSAMLRRVLTRFHRNLSTARICRYDVFRRRGYNHRLIDRAFPTLQEALDFFDFLMDKDGNPYLLQQKALLLSRRGKYPESFVTIDRALGMTPYRNWRLEATHAELLFDANLAMAAAADDARRQVDRAMALLEQCYTSDRRRSLHAFSFARRAVRYHDMFRDEQARDYLVKARQWLLVVARREPYMSATKWLLRDVESQLSWAVEAALPSEGGEAPLGGA